MKKILLLMLFPIMLYGQGSTGNFFFHLWGSGDTLYAGSLSDASTDNHGLNSISLRSDSFWNKYFHYNLDSLRNVSTARVEQVLFDSGAISRAIDMSKLDDLSGTDYWLYFNTTNYWTRSGNAYSNSFTGSGSASSPNIGFRAYPYDGSNTTGIALYELTANGSNYINIRPPNSVTNTYNMKLPADSGTTGQALQWGSGGNLVWAGSDSTGEVNTASNVAGTGIGIFKAKSGFDLQLKRLASTDLNTNLTITDGTDSVKIGFPTAPTFDSIIVGTKILTEASSILYSPSSFGVGNVLYTNSIYPILGTTTTTYTLIPFAATHDLGSSDYPYDDIYADSLVINSIYADSNVSAASFTDRTPFYEGDALTEIKKVKGHNGEIDHSTLPIFAQTKNGERDLGAMISVLTVAVQQLAQQNDSLMNRIKYLEKK